MADTSPLPFPRRLLAGLASLRFAVIIFAALMILVVLCTLAEAKMGVFAAVQTYMRSFLVWWRIPGLSLSIPVFPGGILVGLALLLNLTAALIGRIRLSWGGAGLWTVHIGLILLVAGEFFTGAFQVETHMSIREGQTVNYVQSPRDMELAIQDTTDPAHDLVYGVPASMLRPGASIPVPGTPIVLRVKEFFQNARLAMREPTDPPSIATAGIGAEVQVIAAPPVSSDEGVDLASAYVEPVLDGQSYGTWLVSAGLGAPQTFLHRGRTYALTMRLRRDYLPYAITLKDFRHDVYAGTEIPKNFSSLVRVSNPTQGEERDVLIAMNQPLRYEGRTFYQSGFDPDNQGTILQVVQNPGWTLPYISCTLITLGLVVHFGLSLRRAASQRRTA